MAENKVDPRYPPAALMPASYSSKSLTVTVPPHVRRNMKRCTNCHGCSIALDTRTQKDVNHLLSDSHYKLGDLLGRLKLKLYTSGLYTARLLFLAEQRNQLHSLMIDCDSERSLAVPKITVNIDTMIQDISGSIPRARTTSVG